jgi:hypothetical protein
MRRDRDSRYSDRVTRSSFLLGVLLASGCCGTQVGQCPQNDVAIVVPLEDTSVQVAIEGYPFTCAPGDGAIVCRTASIVDGAYPLLVTVGDRQFEVTLSVATNDPPPYSCQCEIPKGSATIQLGEPEPPADDDAGVPADDAGT